MKQMPGNSLSLVMHNVNTFTGNEMTLAFIETVIEIKSNQAAEVFFFSCSIIPVVRN